MLPEPPAAGRGRAVRHAGGPVPRPHRPGHRPGARDRPDDGAGPAPQRRSALGRRLPRAAQRPHRLPGRRASPPGTRTAPIARRPARAPSDRRCGCSARAATALRSPGCSACPSPSPTTSAAATPCRPSTSTGTSFQAVRGARRAARMVAVRVLVAETDERAAWFGQSSTLSFLRLLQGRPGQVPSPEEAADASVDGRREGGRRGAPARAGRRRSRHRPRRARRPARSHGGRRAHGDDPRARPGGPP